MRTTNELARIAHDPDAFEAFYRANVDAVQRFIVRRVADPYLAADLTSDVFVAAIESAASYRDDRGTPTAWLFGVARRVVASERRRAAREHNAHGRLGGRHLLDDEDVARIEERVDAEAAARTLFAAIERLPDGERAVLELVALDGLSTADAASALGMRAVTARVRLHRARRSLRQQLPAEEPGTEESNANPQPMEAR
jgi:RNA polymerase sigma-70 factor (ECF subfamily)